MIVIYEIQVEIYKFDDETYSGGVSLRIYYVYLLYNMNIIMSKTLMS